MRNNLHAVNDPGLEWLDTEYFHRPKVTLLGLFPITISVEGNSFIVFNEEISNTAPAINLQNSKLRHGVCRSV